MKICIYGAGAIGGTLGVRLAQTGHDVSLIARGANLEAMRANGITLLQGDERVVVKLPASATAVDFGVQDVVIVALKSHTLAAAVEGIAPLLGRDTAIVTAMNGVPWWFFDQWAGASADAASSALQGTRLVACDRDGRIAAALEHHRIIGAVVYMAVEVPQPGVVRWNSGRRVVLGEPSHQASVRVEKLTKALVGAGFEASSTDNIRRELWLKLLGNVCFNPVSVLTGVTTDVMLDDAYMCGLFLGMMREAITLANQLGLGITVDPEARIAQTRKLGAIKSSMLQDVEAGRTIELDAIVGSVVEIAQRLALPAPFINAVYGTVRMRAKALGLYA